MTGPADPAPPTPPPVETITRRRIMGELLDRVQEHVAGALPDDDVTPPELLELDELLDQAAALVRRAPGLDVPAGWRFVPGESTPPITVRRAPGPPEPEAPAPATPAEPQPRPIRERTNRPV